MLEQIRPEKHEVIRNISTRSRTPDSFTFHLFKYTNTDVQIIKSCHQNKYVTTFSCKTLMMVLNGLPLSE